MRRIKQQCCAYLTLRNEAVSRPAAVLVNPQDVLVSAVAAEVVASAVTVGAQVAAVVRVRGHALTNLEVLHSGSRGLDHADELVS